jgi:3-phenylpropionate/trans-cinnamate dioxygenase ferredoxin reductase component
MPGSVVVVGAGLAGLGAVRALRAQDYRGRILLVGAEHHAPYDRPPLSKEFLAGALPVASLDLAAPQDEDLDVERLLGTAAVALDAATRTVHLDTGERVGGDGVVLACGARARQLPGAVGGRPGGPSLVGVHTLRRLEDAVALHDDLRPGARLVVVGAGFIGSEVASTARGLGVEVTVVEAAAVPLAGPLGERFGALCARLHADHGVRLVTGTGVGGLVGDGGTGGRERVRAVRLADGRELAADVVLVAVGSVPEVEWLAGSGLDVAGGVRTDGEGATAVPGVVATGDCSTRHEPLAGRPLRQEHWTNALHHPRRAVAALLGRPAPLPQPQAAVPYFWSDQYGRRLQFAGHREPGDLEQVVDGDPRQSSFVAEYRRDGALVAVLAMDSPRLFTRRRRELAASAAGR